MPVNPSRRRDTLTPERWRRLQDLFERVLPLDADAREQLLASECADDFSLREQVLSLLLASQADSGTFERRVDGAIERAMQLPDLQPGEVIGRYRIVQLLGRGGMGAVYLAERADEQYQQRVALKVVARGLVHGEMANRFRAERQILARLNHPNIARLLDGGTTDDGTPYLVMENVEGLRVDEYCEQHQLTRPARLRLMQQVAAAVQYAHQNLVVHRDLKPSNILVTADGTPKLLDFGIAKLLDAEAGGTSPVTRHRDRILTPEHASPEQLRGEPIGTGSDIYSLGVLLYELLSGHPPYNLANRTLSEIERAICDTTPLPPSARVRAVAASLGTISTSNARAISRELAGDLDNIVLKAMHRDPERRYVTTSALAQDIQNYLDGRPVDARPDSWSYRTGKFLRRNAVPVASAASMVVLITALVAFYTQRLSAERDVAERERATAASVSDFMVDVLRLANPNESPGNTVTVREALDAAAKRIDRDLADQPQLRLTLMRKMGQAYGGLGLWAESRDVLERAAALERKRSGGRSLELAETLAALGHAYHNGGQFDEAGKTFDEAFTLLNTLGHGNDELAIGIIDYIGTNLRAQQRINEALEHHHRAEQLARALQPPSPKTLGGVLTNTAITYSIMGDGANAERYAREAMPLVKGQPIEGDDLYGNVLAALAMAVGRQLRFDEALRLHREFVDRQIQRLGNDHSLVARAWNNFANVLRGAGKYDECERALKEAIRIYSLKSDPKGLDTAVSYHNLGAMYREAGRLEEALPALEKALEMRRASFGPRSAQLVSTLVEIAGTQRGLGHLDAARATLAEAQSIAAEKYDKNDRRHAMLSVEGGRQELVASQASKAGSDAAAKHLTQAEQDLTAAVAGFRAQELTARLPDALGALGEAQLHNGHTDAALASLNESLTLFRQKVPADHWSIADAESRLGEALFDTGQREEGLKLMTESLPKLQARRPAGDPVTLAAERRLAAVTAQTSIAGNPASPR